MGNMVEEVHTQARDRGANTLLDMPYQKYLCILDLVGSERHAYCYYMDFNISDFAYEINLQVQNL